MGGIYLGGCRMKKLWGVKKHFSGHASAEGRAIAIIAEFLIAMDKRLAKVEGILDNAPRDLSRPRKASKRRIDPSSWGIVSHLEDGTPVYGTLPQEKKEPKEPAEKVEPLPRGLPYKDD